MGCRYGAVQGRFQGLHLGHMEFLLEAKKRCDFLIIGITNHDTHSAYIQQNAQLNRFRTDANPFTYFERMRMIQLSLEEAGISPSEFCIVPFPIEEPQRIANYVPLEVVFFQTIYDSWGQKKLETLQSLGYQTQVMWCRTDDQRFASGTQVRERMRRGEEWASLVPPAAVAFIRQHGLDQRLAHPPHPSDTPSPR